MVLLLGSRGRSRGRGRSGIFSSLGRVVHALFGRGSTESSALLRRDARGPAASGWLALGGALLCFALGYLTGTNFGVLKASVGDATAGLDASGGGPRSPALIDDVDTKLQTSEAFVVSAYLNLPPAEAKAKARELSEYLRGKGLQKARPYEFPARDGPLWVVAVYFDGPAEQQATRALLRGLPLDVPDAGFAYLRKDGGEDWPIAQPMR